MRKHAELTALLSATSDASIRRLVYVKGLAGVGVDLSDLLERVENFLMRENYLARPTVATLQIAMPIQVRRCSLYVTYASPGCYYF